MLSRSYTKSDLEKIIITQLENLEAMHDLLRIMKLQSELLQKANSQLKSELKEFKEKHVKYADKKRTQK